jgi:hypothetical protein
MSLNAEFFGRRLLRAAAGHAHVEAPPSSGRLRKPEPMVEVVSGDIAVAVQDRVLVETEVAGKAVAFRAVIVKTGSTELWLGLTNPDRCLESLAQGQQLQLTVARPGCALIGQSAFIRHLGESRSRVFAVVQAPTLERVQRRAHARLQVEMGVRLRRLDAATGEVRGKAALGVTVDASPGGVLFATDSELEVGDLVDVQLTISGDDRISTAARVTRIQIVGSTPAANAAAGGTGPGGTGPGGTVGAAGNGALLCQVGLKFTRITAVDQERILRHCLMVEHRRQMAERQPVADVPAAEPGIPTTRGANLGPAATGPGAFGPATDGARATAFGPATDGAPAGPQPAPAGPRMPAVAAPVKAATAPNAAAVAAAVALALSARAAQENPRPPVPLKTAAPAPKPAASPAFRARLAEFPPDAPPIEIGLSLCESSSVAEIRGWFDGLPPFDRIGLLSQLQANMSGEAVPGANEAGQVRPLAHALGLIS